MCCEASTPESSMCEDFTGGNSCGKVKEFKLPQAVQGPLRRRWSFSLILSLSLVQECILPKNWPFFRSRTNDHTAQCPTHGNAFLRLFVNDYNCYKSCVGTCFSRLYTWLHSNSMSIPEILPRTHSPWLIISGCMPWEMVWWYSYNLEVFFLSIFSSKLKSI